jgi:ribosomal protein S18 acetylase RimI-like enzyme
MNLRDASPADADLVYQIKYQAYAEQAIRSYGSWDEAFQRRYTAGNLPCTKIVLVDDTPMGWIACKEGVKQIEILDLHILPGYQRKGIGGKLISDIWERAARSGKEVHLSVLKTNPSIALYERLGFIANGQTETHILMKKNP